jgi:heat shock protein HslJ
MRRFLLGAWFLAVLGWAGVHLASAQSTTNAVPLEGTRWNLTWLGDTPVESATPEQSPNLVLDPATQRVSGSTGCNRLVASYHRLRGRRIRFDQGASTRMACVKGMETEAAFLKALEQTKRWRISGQRLILYGPTGRPVARFTTPTR